MREHDVTIILYSVKKLKTRAHSSLLLAQLVVPMLLLLFGVVKAAPGRPVAAAVDAAAARL